MAVISITEPTGRAGYEIALNMAGRLGFVLIDSYFIKNKLRNRGASSLHDTAELPFLANQSLETIKKLVVNQALKNNIVVLNLGGEILFHNIAGTLHVKIASKSKAVSFTREAKINNNNFKKFIKSVYGIKRIDNNYYDLLINLNEMDTDFISELILRVVDLKALTSKAGVTWNEINKLKKNLNNYDFNVKTAEHIPELKIPEFAHPSEREFAKFLDYYRIRWEYEPRSFILEKDESGRIKEKFTPDFYLTDMDLYIELTTMKQKLVTSKNRKIKKLKQLYPDLNIKIFYGRDYEKLLIRFGLK